VVKPSLRKKEVQECSPPPHSAQYNELYLTIITHLFTGDGFAVSERNMLLKGFIHASDIIAKLDSTMSERMPMLHHFKVIHVLRPPSKC